MKKLVLLTGLIISLLFFTQAKAQDAVTAKTAKASNGYTVLNKDGQITIFKYMHRAHSPKETEKYAAKYYFTISFSDVLQPLTKENLKKSFPENHPFHDALDANFKYDNELTLFDTFHKMYKINWLIKQNS